MALLYQDLFIMVVFCYVSARIEVNWALKDWALSWNKLKLKQVKLFIRWLQWTNLCRAFHRYLKNCITVYSLFFSCPYRIVYLHSVDKASYVKQNYRVQTSRGGLRVSTSTTHLALVHWIFISDAMDAWIQVFVWVLKWFHTAYLLNVDEMKVVCTLNYNISYILFQEIKNPKSSD